MKILRVLSILSGLISSVAFACTGIQLTAKDGTVVNGRTAEFAVPITLSMMVVPENYHFKSKLFINKNKSIEGMSYHSKYAFFGATSFNDNAIIDGLNEKGLSVGTFYFPNYANYTDVSMARKSHALSPTQFTNWLLSQFATINEVKKNLDGVEIVGVMPSGWGIVPPFHYIVYDKTGQSIVIEPLAGKLKVYDNPTGAITNSPTFDWHLTNLVNYINLSTNSISYKVVDKYMIKAFGQGSGLHGLPGDFTPPSRFVRAVFFSKSAVPAPNSDTAVHEAFHILNQFDIPPGSVRSVDNNKTTYDYTLATIVKDPQSLKIYYKTYANQTVQTVSLNEFDWKAQDIKTVPVEGTVAFFAK